MIPRLLTNSLFTRQKTHFLSASPVISHNPLQEKLALMHYGAGGTAAVVTSHGVDSERVFSK